MVFLHLGGSSVVPTAEVIMILDLKIAKESRITTELLQLLEAEGLIEEVNPGSAKSLVVTDEKAYLSPISSVTLKNRLYTWMKD